MTKFRAPFLIAMIAAFGLCAAPASATEFSNPAPIVVPDQGDASPSPSQIAVNSVRGPISRLVLTLHGVSHERPTDLDLLLVSPDGRKSKVMSDACGFAGSQNRIYVFPTYGTPDYMPHETSCFSGAYRTTDYDIGTNGDFWSNEPPGGYGPLSDLNGTDPNGTWKLYVADDAAGSVGSIARGWSLDIEPVQPDALLPTLGTFGVADPYPMTRTVSGVNGVVTDVDVTFRNLYHSRPDDLDAYLVAPGGQKVALMSDACGETDLEARSWTLDDETSKILPDGGAGNVCPGTTRYRPADYEPGDAPPGGPGGPYASALSEFDLTDPNGDWRLFVNDDSDGESGWFSDFDPVRTTPFDLLLTTRPKADVAFAAADVSVTEGGRAELVVRRTGAEPLGVGSVTVASAAGSATDGDFTPVATKLEFAAGEVEKVIPIQATADGEAEGDEALTVSLGQAGGDARVAAPQTATMTIRDSEVGQDAGGGGDQAGGKVGPETVIEKGPKRKTTRPRAKVLFTSNDADARFECKVDRGAFRPCASPRRLKKLRVGRHTFQVRAVDAAGNADPTPAKRRWRIVRRPR